MINLRPLTATAEAVESYIEANLFDSVGLMYSGIDSHTNQPFARDFITPCKVPRRAAFDPWSYWTYEDSVMSMGLYLDGLVLQYEVTGDEACLHRAHGIWTMIERVYSCSQVYGLGSFLRPYGGFLTMQQFMEPLGTDQASPLFSGLYRYLPHASAAADDIRRVMRSTLEWYERQGFQYFYYKSFIHRYSPGDSLAHHANSYYLPALAWAAREFREDKRWQRHLAERLGHFQTGDYILWLPGSGQPAFCWGSDLAILKDILGPRFDEVFTAALLDGAYTELNNTLASYEQPGFFRRACPESDDPDFQPSVDPEFDYEKGLGFAYFATRHHGRRLPRHEQHVLLGLAAVAYRREETLARAAELLALRARVPQDFTAFIAEDYDKLPETVHLYARSVGVNMVGWWRDYWLLRSLTAHRTGTAKNTHE